MQVNVRGADVSLSRVLRGCFSPTPLQLFTIYKVLPATTLAEPPWGPGPAITQWLLWSLKWSCHLEENQLQGFGKKENSGVIQRSIQQHWGIHWARTERSLNFFEGNFPWKFWSWIDTYRSACIRSLPWSDFPF